MYVPFGTGIQDFGKSLIWDHLHHEGFGALLLKPMHSRGSMSAELSSLFSVVHVVGVYVFEDMRLLMKTANHHH